MRWSPKSLIALAIVPIAIAAAACGSTTTTPGGSSSSSGGSPTADSAASGKLPASVRSKGTLTVAEDASYPPDEFIGADGTTVEGMDADLAKAIGAVLGLKVSISNATFATIIPGLQSGKYDVGISSYFDTKEREKVIDFVTYFQAGASFLVKASGGPNIQTLDDLCGHTAGVESGTTEKDDATAQDTKCKGAGKPGVSVQVYSDQSSANLALGSDRVDVVILDSQVARYQAKLNNQFKVVGKEYGVTLYGIAVPKGTGMAAAVLAALKDLISSGVYKNILKTWNLEGNAITTPVINGATS